MNDVHAEVLSLGRRRLIPGVEYLVSSEFSDEDRTIHPSGERWIYFGIEYSKMFPGHSIHTRTPDGVDMRFRLRWGSNGQAEVINNFEKYVLGPVVDSPVLLNKLSPDAKSAFERVRNRLAPIPNKSDTLIEHVLEKYENAHIAAMKSDNGDYEQLASDFAKVARELEQALEGHNV